MVDVKVGVLVGVGVCVNPAGIVSVTVFVRVGVTDCVGVTV